MKQKPKTRKPRRHRGDEDAKQLIAITREYNALDRALARPAIVPLEKPMRRGWVRYYTLSVAGRRHPKAALLNQILSAITSRHHHWRRNFIYGRRRARFIDVQPALKGFRARNWVRTKQPLEWQPFFGREYRLNRGHREPWFVFRELELIQLRVEPFMITHVEVIDGEAVSRREKLTQWLERHAGRRRYGRMRGKSERKYSLWEKRTPRTLLARMAAREVREAMLIPIADVESEEMALQGAPSLPLPLPTFRFCRGASHHFQSCRLSARTALFQGAKAGAAPVTTTLSGRLRNRSAPAF